jgi:hypothetical protein
MLVCNHFANGPFSVWVAASQLPSTLLPLFLLYAAWPHLVNRDTVSRLVLGRLFPTHRLFGGCAAILSVAARRGDISA